METKDERFTRLLEQLRELNGKAAHADHEWQCAIDMVERANADLIAAPATGAAFDRVDEARRFAEERRQRFFEALVRVWVTARAVAGAAPGAIVIPLEQPRAEVPRG